jgi:3-deoxy-D-manno-octulosonic-acid transferase
MLLDTLGELTTAYGACAAAYVGGSYTEGKGGHNVMEPLLSRVPVAYGRVRGHFEALQRLCEQHGVSARIADADELAAFFTLHLTDADERERVGAEGRRVIEASRGAVARTVDMLLPLLDRPL